MATDPQTIIDAIDSAIAQWAGKPVSLSINGTATTYRSLVELVDARKYYVSLVNTPDTGKMFFLRRMIPR
jgi:hypothetical protein